MGLMALIPLTPSVPLRSWLPAPRPSPFPAAPVPAPPSLRRRCDGDSIGRRIVRCERRHDRTWDHSSGTRHYTAQRGTGRVCARIVPPHAQQCERWRGAAEKELTTQTRVVTTRVRIAPSPTGPLHIGTA